MQALCEVQRTLCRKKIVVKVQPKKSKVGQNERDEQDCSITMIEEKERFAK